MKKLLFTISLLLLPFVSNAQVTTHAGGTGLVDISAGSIPFGSVYNVRMATSSAFQFNTAASRLIATYASTTAITGTTVCIGTDCKTAWPTSGGGSGNVATSTGETAGNLSYWTSTNATPAALGKVATTSVSCSGSVSCSAFTVIGASPITISSAGGTASTTLLADNNTFSGLNQFTNAGTTTYSGNLDITGNMRVRGNSQLDINMFASGNAQIGNTLIASNVLATSSAINYFIGNTGIGTTTPTDRLHVFNTTDGEIAKFDSTGATVVEEETYIRLTDGTANMLFSVGPTYSNGGYIGMENEAPLYLVSGNVQELTILFGGYTGIGSTTPSERLSVQGNALISGNISAANLTATGTLSVLGQTTLASASSTNLGLTGTGGQGYITLKGQSSAPSSPPAGSILLHAITENGFTRLERDNESATNIVYGRDNVFIANNSSGVTINKGEAVYESGTVNNVPQISKARANAASTMPVIGIAAENITHLSYGSVMTQGVLTFDTSSFSDGNQVWVSPTTAGALTATRPSGTTNFVQRMGTILVSGNSTTGKMLVQVAPAVLNMETGTNATSWTATKTTATYASTTQLTLGGQLFDGANSNGTGGFILMSRGGALAPTWVATSSINNGVTSVATNNGLTGGTITTTGTLGFDLTKIVNNTLVMYNGSQLQATGTPALTVGYVIATTTTASQLPQASTTLLSVSGTIYSKLYSTFSYATSTWTGTTTLPLGVATLPETWNSVQCYTDTGTLNVAFNDGTNFMNYLNASTTVGTVTLFTNNTFTAAEKRYVTVGTPASSPTQISCTVTRQPN